MAARSGNLVQRQRGPKNATKTEGGSLVSGGDHKIVQSPDLPSDEDGQSMDKETRLTLMEEVLLLGLKDKEVMSTKNISMISRLAIDVIWLNNKTVTPPPVAVPEFPIILSVLGDTFHFIGKPMKLFGSLSLCFQLQRVDLFR